MLRGFFGNYRVTLAAWQQRHQVHTCLGADDLQLLSPVHCQAFDQRAPPFSIQELHAADMARKVSLLDEVGEYSLVAMIFAVKLNSLDEFARQAEIRFASYRAAGAREAGILVTLDVANNFPQLPVRTDGLFLVWLGVLKDNDTLERQFTPAAGSSMQTLSAGGLLRGTPELLVLDPTLRLRLRWLP